MDSNRAIADVSSFFFFPFFIKLDAFSIPFFFVPFANNWELMVSVLVGFRRGGFLQCEFK